MAASAKAAPVIDDEDVQQDCRDWLRTQKPESLTSQAFAAWVNCTLLPKHDSENVIGQRQARRWLRALGS